MTQRPETSSAAAPASFRDGDGPVRLDAPRAPLRPVVVACPHSGRRYPTDFLARTPLDLATIRASEDAFMDQMVGWAPEEGAAALVATFPRAFIDVNRDAREVDPAMVKDAPKDFEFLRSAKVAAGLGCIPRIVGPGRAIGGGSLTWREVRARIEGCYAPYHAALRRALAEVTETFGGVLLLDAHSMPSGGFPKHDQPDLILGDLNGCAAAPAIMDLAETAFREAGFHVRRNKPYAGAHVLRTYGAPLDNRHAVQLELNRALYLDEARLLLRADAGAVRERLRRACVKLFDAAAPLLQHGPSE